MADNTGIAKKESPIVEETVSEVQTQPEQQPRPEEVPKTVEVQEVEVQPETQEQKPEQQEDVQEEQPSADEPVVTPTTTPVAAPAPVEVDVLAKQINSILEEDLKDMFLSMSPEQQQQFKEKGEETASKIRVLVSGAKVNAKKVFHLIRGWLKLIPGVNRFFLEQEAKIKTDKILLVTEEEKKRQNEL